jgi:hypothetical protein
MSFFVTYKKVSSKNMRIPTDEGYKNVLRYGFLVNYKFQGSSKLKTKYSGYSFQTEQEAKKSMQEFINSLNPTKSKQEDYIDLKKLSDEEVHDLLEPLRTFRQQWDSNNPS